MQTWKLQTWIWGAGLCTALLVALAGAALEPADVAVKRSHSAVSGSDSSSRAASTGAVDSESTRSAR